MTNGITRCLVPVRPPDTSKARSKFVWCDYHKMWCDHVEDGCKKKERDKANKNKSDDKGPTNGKSGNPKSKKEDAKLSYAKAILTMIEEEQEEE